MHNMTLDYAYSILNLGFGEPTLDIRLVHRTLGLSVQVAADAACVTRYTIRYIKGTTL